MLVKIYENAQMFLNEHEQMMLEREAESQLILYNAYVSKNKNVDELSLFGAVMNEGITKLLFCNVAPYHLVVFVADNSMELENKIINLSTKTLANYLITKEIPISGINARCDVCQELISFYKTNTSNVFKRRLVMDIMEIRTLADLKLVKGNTRLAVPEDKSIITDWMIQFDIETLACETDYEKALEIASKLIDDHNIYLFENENEEVVSMAATTRKLHSGIAISRIFTPEEYRGMGYAATNLYHICEMFLDRGYEFCTLFADENSPMSSRTYEKIGFYILAQQYEYEILYINEIYPI